MSLVEFVSDAKSPLHHLGTVVLETRTQIQSMGYLPWSPVKLPDSVQASLHVA